ncbi:hypothetical protein ACFV80_36235 [Streptomyces sp. NPDC059862]|uniref:hypothetical protein n=1 Tax=Streptomyces sp. NPDC059862 TaxID=3346975 RepID=UPI0036493B2B
MSWDVFIMRFPPKTEAVDEIAGDWEPPSLGAGRAVRAVLAELLPGIEYSASGWDDYEGPGFSTSTPVNEPDDAPVVGPNWRSPGTTNAGSQARRWLRKSETDQQMAKVD